MFHSPCPACVKQEKAMGTQTVWLYDAVVRLCTVRLQRVRRGEWQTFRPTLFLSLSLFNIMTLNIFAGTYNNMKNDVEVHMELRC